MMDYETMKALEERLLNNPAFDNQRFPDVEIIEETDVDTDTDDSDDNTDISSVKETNDLDILWSGF